MKRIVISELMWPSGVKLLEAEHGVLYDAGLWKDRPRLLSHLAESTALIVRNQTQVDEEVLSASPRLKVVGRLGVGLDNLDRIALEHRGITVVYGGNANALSVAEYTLAAMLALARKIPAAEASTKAGGWERAKFTGFELYGKTLGLIGLGEVGSRVAKRSHAFGMKLLAYDPLLTSSHFAVAEFGVELASLEEVLRSSDFVSLHLPLLPSTAHLINEECLSLMKPIAYLINSSRGGIVDEAALAEALRQGRLGGAALDVRAEEPPAKEDPFAGMDTVLLTPHIAGLTEEAQDRICTSVAEDVLRVLRGEEPLFSVR